MNESVTNFTTLEQLKVVKDLIPSRKKPLMPYEMSGVWDRWSNCFICDEIETGFIDAPYYFKIPNSLDLVHITKYDAYLGGSTSVNLPFVDSLRSQLSKTNMPKGTYRLNGDFYIIINGEQETLQYDYVDNDNNSYYLVYSSTRSKDDYYFKIRGINNSSLSIEVVINDQNGVGGHIWWKQSDEVIMRANLTCYHMLDSSSIKEDSGIGDNTKQAIADNTAARHTHENKDVLDSITLGDINFWGDNWEYINRVGTDTDVAALVMDVDKNGTSIVDLDLKAVAVLIYSPATTNTSNTVQGRAIALQKSAFWGRGTLNCNSVPLSARKEEGCYFVTVIRERSGYLMQDVELSSTGNYGNIKQLIGWVTQAGHAPITFNSNGDDVFDLAASNPKMPIDCIKICGYTNYAAPAGTVMEVYGIRR